MPAITVTSVNTGTDELTAVAHGLLTGDRFRVRNVGGALPAATPALAAVTDYFAVRMGPDTLKVATSNANALAGTAIDITGAGSGTTTIEFNLPYCVPRIAANGTQIMPQDDNAAWNALVALYDLLTGQAQSTYDGMTLAGALTVGGQPLSFVDLTYTADSTTDQITKTAHGLETGDGPERTSNVGGALPGGLAAGTDYYFIKVDADHGKLATSRANAIAGIAIDLTSNGTGTQTLLHQAGTTRVSDATVTRNLAVNGDIRHSDCILNIHGCAGRATSNVSYGVGGAGAITTTGAASILYSLDLRAADRIKSVSVVASGDGAVDITNASVSAWSGSPLSIGSTTVSNVPVGVNTITIDVTDTRITAAMSVFLQIDVNAAGLTVVQVRVTYDRPPPA